MKKATVVLSVFALAVAVGGPVFGAENGASDPQDARGALDIKRISHEERKDVVVYRAEMHAAFDNKKDFFLVRWDFDLNGDGRAADGCIFVELVPDDTGKLRATLYPKCGREAWSTADATRPAPNIFEFQLRTRDLVNGAGFPSGKPVAYRVSAEDQKGNDDVAPNDGLVTQGSLPVVPTEPPVRQRLTARNPVAQNNDSGGYVSAEGPPAAASTGVDQATGEEPVTGRPGVPLGMLVGGVAAGVCAGAVAVAAIRRRPSSDSVLVYDDLDDPYRPEPPPPSEPVVVPVAPSERKADVDPIEFEPVDAKRMSLADLESFASAGAPDDDVDQPPPSLNPVHTADT